MAVPVSTHQVESAVLQAKEDALWTAMKALAFDKLAPNKVLATKWTEGGENQGVRRCFHASRVWRACDCVTEVSAALIPLSLTSKRCSGRGAVHLLRRRRHMDGATAHRC